ncbi:DNA polymerase III subunit delta [Mycoplasmopsis cynos]|uniref:DNA polymerase III subunit delta n=2 Tax=Mycoplasmopsis cynos TaxID=171284 RepID=A0ABD8AJR7_9BACT|nr:DNA polymerase III subunit delta [Mycoplasmopsis cynos]MCU9933389.1 DNA polymerase III subunit delta [Mycoplasmopsis cynos]UWV80909.1 DNA polymerase III subunit delta [Mycoplasmopsis cynos]WQQ13475.1 DNA polymerase III subunit delta [Mycoplasmopsis cynos]WQQ13750.1 DNA polymerase III subunit delta [Mycoplasmopsis cynos]WQQ15023.1 DNA polymerase III subunit delta [Mycoplasmopsis cynos]
MKLIYGSEKFFITKNLNKEKAKYLDIDILVFDNNIDLSELLEKISNPPLFSNKKLIVINDFELLTISKFNKKQDKIADEYIKFLSSNILDEIIFVCNFSKLIDNKFTTFLKKKAEIIESKKLEKDALIKQLNILAKSHNIKISYINIETFIEKMPDNLEIIMNEFENLISNYKEISYDLIENVVAKYSKNQAFSFLNSIETYDLKKIYDKYLERTSEGDEIYLLLNQINSIFSDCLTYYHLVKIGLNTNEICSKMKVPEWKIKKLSVVLKRYGVTKIKKIIYDLAEIDVKIKSYVGDVNEIFEMFLIKNF